MHTAGLIVSLLLAFAAADGPTDAGAIIEDVKAIQHAIEDFSCEYEGTIRYNHEQLIKLRKLKIDGLYDTFSGNYIWRANGDTRCEWLHRYEPDGQFTQEGFIVRAKKREAESYLKINDSPSANVIVQSVEDLFRRNLGSFEEIFPLEEIKVLASRDSLTSKVSDERIDGKKVKCLTFTLKDTGQIMDRFWIDLRRGAHTVRRETFFMDDVGARVEIALAPFRIGDTEVWMPVKATKTEYLLFSKGKKPVVSKEPVTTQIVYVNNGTSHFNTHPKDDVFESKHKPGTQVSDKIKQLKYRAGQQVSSLHPTKKAAEVLLKEQLAQAEEQASELRVDVESESFPWHSVFMYLFGVSALATSAILLFRRARR